MPICLSPGFPYNLDSPEWEIHVLTGALKLFFRELKEPLIPFSSFDSFMAANREYWGTEVQHRYKSL